MGGTTTCTHGLGTPLDVLSNKAILSLVTRSLGFRFFRTRWHCTATTLHNWRCSYPMTSSSVAPMLRQAVWEVFVPFEYRNQKRHLEIADEIVKIEHNDAIADDELEVLLY